MPYSARETRSLRGRHEKSQTSDEEDNYADKDETQRLPAAELAQIGIKNKLAAAENELQKKISEVDDLELELQKLQEKNAKLKEAERTPVSELRALKEKIYTLKNDIGHLRDLVWAKSALDVKNRGLDDLRQELEKVADPESPNFARLKQAIETLENEVVELNKIISNWDKNKRLPRLRVVTDPQVEAAEAPDLPEPNLNEQLRHASTQLAIRAERLAKLLEEQGLSVEQRQSRLDDLALQQEINELKDTLIPESENRIAALEQTTKEMPMVAA